MISADQRIADILGRFDEPVAGSIWKVQGQPVIYHKALERIAIKAGIRFDRPTIVRAERDEAVILVIARLGEREEWSIGEALINVNYRVSGKQAAYVYALAEKRAKDRCVLKLIELHGLLYSEEEADEFREAPPPEPPPKPKLVPAAPKPEPEVAAEKRKLSEMPPSAQSGITAQKPAFWAFLNETFGTDVKTEVAATAEIYKACEIETRRDLVPGSKAEMRWLALRRRFEQWCQDAP